MRVCCKKKQNIIIKGYRVKIADKKRSFSLCKNINIKVMKSQMVNQFKILRTLRQKNEP